MYGITPLRDSLCPSHLYFRLQSAQLQCRWLNHRWLVGHLLHSALSMVESSMVGWALAPQCPNMCPRRKSHTRLEAHLMRLLCTCITDELEGLLDLLQDLVLLLGVKLLAIFLHELIGVPSHCQLLELLLAIGGIQWHGVEPVLCWERNVDELQHIWHILLEIGPECIVVLDRGCGLVGPTVAKAAAIAATTSAAIAASTVGSAGTAVSRVSRVP